MALASFSSLAWHLLTRVGEAQILLPAMAATLVWLSLHARSRPLAWRWLSGTVAATALTTATKIAFIGFGLGFAPLDFSGLSGHAMFSSSLLPLMIALLLLHSPQARLRAIDLLPGAALALLIAVSRVRLGAHSWSEVVLGGSLGCAVNLWVLAAPGGAQRPPRAPHAATWLLAGWLLALPVGAPQAQTHAWVTALSLKVSGHSRPYTREQMRRAYRDRHGCFGPGLQRGSA